MELSADALATLLATGLYLSYIPSRLAGRGGSLPRFTSRGTGAGFVGTLEALILLPWLPREPRLFAIFLCLAVAASFWLCHRAEIYLGTKDDSRIVLDEIVGFWAAAAFLPRTWAVLAAAFVLFRLFDTFKPWPTRYFERLPGGFGVVSDDLAAAAFTQIILRIALARAWL